VGIALGAFLLSETLLKGRFGAWADRVGPARPLAAGAILATTSAVLTAGLPDFPGINLVLVALRLVDGVAAAMIWPSVFAWASHLGTEATRPRLLAAVNACYFIGVALAFPIGGFANDATGSKSAGIWTAVIIFGALALLLGLRPPRVQATSTSPKDNASSTDISSGIAPFLVLGFVLYAAIGFPSFILKLLPIREFGITESQVGAAVLPGALILAALSGPIAKTIARLGPVIAIRAGLGIALIGAGVLAAAFFFPQLRQLPLLVACSIPLGIGFLLATPAWYTVVTELDPAKKGRNLGAVMTAQGLGAMIAGPTGAWIFETASFGPFVGTFACLLLGCGLAYSRLLSAKVDSTRR